MEELSADQNKCMLKLRGKRLIEYSLDNAASLEEVNEIVVVVGYRAESIINCYGTQYGAKRVCYVIQREQRGLVHAMESARPHFEQDDLLLFLADEVIIAGRHREMIRFFEESGLFCVCGVHPQPDLEMIKRTYSLICGPDNRIYRLIEKPRKPFTPVMGTGNMVFRKEIFNYLDVTPINTNRGEKELPDLIQCAIDDGEKVHMFEICGEYVNVNSPEEWRIAENVGRI
jgi:NDP-sugar pyrophosphorylase family protein